MGEKRKQSEPAVNKYPHHVSLNTAKLPLNELIFYDWMRFLVHNIMGDYLKWKKIFWFFSIFQVHAPLKGIQSSSGVKAYFLMY